MIHILYGDKLLVNNYKQEIIQKYNIQPIIINCTHINEMCQQLRSKSLFANELLLVLEYPNDESKEILLQCNTKHNLIVLLDTLDKSTKFYKHFVPIAEITECIPPFNDYGADNTVVQENVIKMLQNIPDDLFANKSSGIECLAKHCGFNEALIQPQLCKLQLYRNAKQQPIDLIELKHLVPHEENQGIMRLIDSMEKGNLELVIKILKTLFYEEHINAEQLFGILLKKIRGWFLIKFYKQLGIETKQIKEHIINDSKEYGMTATSYHPYAIQLISNLVENATIEELDELYNMLCKLQLEMRKHESMRNFGFYCFLDFFIKMYCGSKHVW